MMPLSDREQTLNEIISVLNHKMTGTLARLEGLYLLYKQEGKFQEELWEVTLQQAKHDTFKALNQSFELTSPQPKIPMQVA